MKMRSLFSKLKINLRSRDRRKEERIRRQVDKEDFLLSQIDEFREKAKQLQGLLNTKESKVKELQNIVDEREGKAVQLQSILDEKQKQADAISKSVSDQIDVMIGKVDEKLEEVNKNIDESLSDNIEKIKEQTEEVKTSLEEMKSSLEQMKNEIIDKVHTEDVQCFRNVKDLMDEFGTKVEGMEEVKKSTKSIKSYVKCLSWFSIINFIVLAAYILYSLGAFNF